MNLEVELDLALTEAAEHVRIGQRTGDWFRVYVWGMRLDNLLAERHRIVRTK